jgi:hypothetical protein
MLLSNNNRIQFELRGVWSDGKISSLVVHSVALVRHSNRLVPFFRKCQGPGAGSPLIPRYARDARFARQARCDLSCVRPERTNRSPLWRPRPRSGFTDRKSWPEEIPFRRKEGRKWTGRQSGLGRGHTPLGCVSVRPLCPFPLGSGLIVVRPRSFVPSQWVVDLYPVISSTMAAKPSLCRSIALPRWWPSCGRLSGPG